MGYVYRGTVHDLTAPLVELPEPVRKGRKGPAPFDPSKCGTTAGYKQHRAHNLEQCKACMAACRVYHNDWKARKRNGEPVRKGFRDDACGTYAGYHRHKRHGVPACDPCETANTEYTSAYRLTHRAA